VLPPTDISVDLTLGSWVPALLLKCHQKTERRWGDNIRMYLREIGWEVVDWMHLAQDRVQWRTLVKTVVDLRVP